MMSQILSFFQMFSWVTALMG